ncbi:hypothetical protein [Cohnella yongneupensis]|uniref:Uncharacterized protein n=1 Tax=Cohnella yongneupensis TaxID=425006 RepID=A0ABW0R094_9BACL
MVNPETMEFRVYSLFEAVLEDDYSSDAITMAYGFLDDRKLLYVAVVNDANRKGGYYYSAQTLDILNGQRETVLDLDIDATSISYFAARWLNESKDRLILNSNSGPLWIIDLAKREMKQHPRSFETSWPFLFNGISPDGERFWHDRLYDASGRALADGPSTDGDVQYPEFRWSPDSRYSIFQDTRDHSDEHEMEDNGEYIEIATERIRFFDKQGNLLRTVQTKAGSGRYIEVAGWLDVDGFVLLREYRLEPSPEYENVKVKGDIHYRLLNLASGKSTELKVTDDIAKLTSPVPVREKGSLSILAMVDVDHLLVEGVGRFGYWLSKPGDKKLAWVAAYSDRDDIGDYRTFDLSSGKLTKQPIVLNYDKMLKLGEGWLISGANYTRLIPQD